MSLEIKVCLGCYASYNEGYLFDKWYHCTDEIDLDEAIKDFTAHVMKSVKTARPYDMNILDTYAEELYIADSEVLYNDSHIDINFHESISAVREIFDVFDQNFNHPIGLLIEVMKNRGDSYDELKSIDDDLFAFEIDSESDEDIGYAYAERTDLMRNADACETLKNYFDYKAFGRDLYATTYSIDGKYYAVLDN
jgi:hypothetical protein